MTSNRPYLLRAVYEWICDNGLTPQIVVDATRPGVHVPPQAISDGKVVLNIAPRAVAHLEIGNDMVTFMARFGGASHAVGVPVAAVQAVFARENGQGMLLPDDAPGTVPAGEPSDAASGKPSTPSLQAVPGPERGIAPAGEDDAEAGSADGGKPDKPRPRGKPSLRVIK